ncbi:MAG: hypothetical protein N2170_07415 [Bacteroidia bacterium]|nr:hypothetical protein [Bacteroidia bacterium]
MEPSQLRALMRLIEDPDPEVQAHIEAALKEVGQAAIPLLEQQWLQAEDPTVQRRIEELLEHLQLELVGQALYEWRLNPEQPLFPALMYVAQLRYPSLDITKYTHAYRRLIHTTWLAFPANSDPFEKLLAINRQLFLQERFQPEQTRPFTPRYFFLHEVLDTHRGNTFSLALLYYLVASELSLEVTLIAVGGRYLVRYFDGAVHFYIDPYQRGFFLLPGQLKEVLQRANLSDNLAHYRPLSPPYIILRLIEHLEQAYAREGDGEKQALYAALRARIDLQI